MEDPRLVPLVVEVLVGEVLSTELVTVEALLPDALDTKVPLPFVKLGTDVLSEPVAPEVGVGKLSVSLN